MVRDPPPAATAEAARIERVRRELDRVAGPGGFVRFDRFMEIALYAEEIGYYARDDSPLGPAGDFYTAGHVHPLFGRTIGARVLEIRRTLGRDRPFEIFEIGPGDGTLAASLLASLVESGEPLEGLSYHLVEISPALARRSLERARAAAGAHLPVRVDPAVGASGPFEGVVVGNEFLDALPGRRLRWTGDGWSELGFRRSGTGFVPAEATADPTDLPRDLATPREPGAIAEVSPAAESWIRTVADHLVRGAVVLIDYGNEENEQFSAHPEGTVASFRRHQELRDFWSEPGASDLSMFVNFTRLRAAARRAGFAELAYGPQSEALAAWGFARQLEAELARAPSAEAEVRLRLAAKNLLFGFERFRVLELVARSCADALGPLRWPVA